MDERGASTLRSFYTFLNILPLEIWSALCKFYKQLLSKCKIIIIMGKNVLPLTPLSRQGFPTEIKKSKEELLNI